MEVVKIEEFVVFVVVEILVLVIVFVVEIFVVLVEEFKVEVVELLVEIKEEVFFIGWFCDLIGDSVILFIF